MVYAGSLIQNTLGTDSANACIHFLARCHQGSDLAEAQPCIYIYRRFQDWHYQGCRMRFAKMGCGHASTAVCWQVPQQLQLTCTEFSSNLLLLALICNFLLVCCLLIKMPLLYCTLSLFCSALCYSDPSVSHAALELAAQAVPGCVTLLVTYQTEPTLLMPPSLLL